MSSMFGDNSLNYYYMFANCHWGYHCYYKIYSKLAFD